MTQKMGVCDNCTPFASINRLGRNGVAASLGRDADMDPTRFVQNYTGPPARLHLPHATDYLALAGQLPATDVFAIARRLSRSASAGITQYSILRFVIPSDPLTESRAVPDDIISNSRLRDTLAANHEPTTTEWKPAHEPSTCTESPGAVLELMILGGEYSGPNLDKNFTNATELYDPVTQKWTVTAPVTNLSEGKRLPVSHGDEPAVTLPDGTVLTPDGGNTNTYLYNDRAPHVVERNRLLRPYPILEQLRRADR